ncbi:Thiol:disulfide interchange protein DsbD precursor [Pirellulimonas nuda]|uniref:Thiol:disulfide interchange protein DsbD n=1 Tax=Pirellulimonas nuda TaxID=2528009 RepID=A0A518DGC2_9BACT|nr:thioredoxin family protein [Pirellulimonas nuda]QDU90524.1 Thiol:disulfide interchange protein DsbD precursor [Pirellulimonas nuda]
MSQRNGGFAATLLVLALFFCAAPARAQFDFLGGGIGDGPQPVELAAQFTPATAERPAVLMVTATIEPGYHVYGVKQPAGGPQRTDLTLAPSSDYRLLGEFRGFPAPHTYIDEEVFTGVEIHEHEDQVTWYAPIELAEGVDPNKVKVAGSVSLQACDESCIPLDLEFTAKLGKGVEIGPLPEATSPAAAAPVTPEVNSGAMLPAAPAPSDSAYRLEKIELGKQRSLPTILLLALMGGFVLNFMPCVLPVIGLKIMSFVNQSGHSRSKAFALNVWYSLGILLVFWVLAGLAIFAGATFGDHFGDARFNVVMSSIVFALALAMLGVWEIPIPGFVGHGAAQEIASQEGPTGALAKGILTTILATPCTGPGVGAALGWTVKQSPAVTFGVFTTLGLGMALPYLLIGAFPSLVKFLPKPGAWMDTFKQFLGFVLMATVVWLLSSLPQEMLLPTLAFLTTVAMACWVYSRIPYGAEWGDRSQSYALTAAILAGGAVLSYGFLLPDVYGPRYQATVAMAANEQASQSTADLIAALRDSTDSERATLLSEPAVLTETVLDRPWQPFTLDKLAQVVIGQGRPVLVDFSADWCANCKVLEGTVLHTDAVDAAMERHGVVTMYADFTHKPQFLKDTLRALGANGVPVIAVFSPSDPYRPIVFRGAYTQSGLIEAIEKAAGGSSAVKVAQNTAN